MQDAGPTIHLTLEQLQSLFAYLLKQAKDLGYAHFSVSVGPYVLEANHAQNRAHDLLT